MRTWPGSLFSKLKRKLKGLLMEIEESWFADQDEFFI